MIPLSLADTGGLTADGLLPLTGFPSWMWGSDILNGQLWGGTEIAEPAYNEIWTDPTTGVTNALLPSLTGLEPMNGLYDIDYQIGYPEMPQPPTYNPNTSYLSSTASIDTSAGFEKSSPNKIAWDDTFDPFGFNSTTLKGFGSVLSDVSSSLSKKRSYANYVASYENKAQALRNQAESAYRIAGINMSRLRGNQAKYLAKQRVSAVRTGFAPTSGSIGAVQQATMSQFEQQIADAWVEAEQKRQNTMYQASVADWRASEARKASKRSSGGFLGSLLGSGVGAYFGGPTGMAIGSKIGSSIGGLF